MAVRRWIACSSILAFGALGSPVLGDPASPPPGGPLTPAQLASLDLGTYPSPATAPEFSLQTPKGRTVSPAGLRGKVVLLNFWATWCRECRPEMLAFEALHARFGARGLAVVGINTRERPTAVLGYARELGLTFPLLLDPDGTVTGRYGVVGLPTTFLIGRDGRAIALAVGAREWAGEAAMDIVQTLLADPAGETGRRGKRP